MKKRNWKIEDLEKETQRRSKNKDLNFRLSNFIAEYLFRIDKFEIYEVDGEWIRNNLNSWWGWGGHGKVYPFIQNDQIWITKDHADIEEMSRTIIHEIYEYKLMSKLSYWKAHQIALKEEHKHPKMLKEIAKKFREVRC